MTPSLPRPRARRLIAVAVAVLAAGAGLPAVAVARTRTTQSTNWSGYAMHEHGVRFRRATASWRQPTASCTSQGATYSSFWVGIGGYSTSSDALEQIGTELDCTRAGTVRSTAWYELVPADRHAIHLTVAPGDLIHASVTVRGTRVTLVLADRTRGERFARTLRDDTLDQSSAEWIAEAPSSCAGSDCTVLPLTDFSSATFLSAAATSTAGATHSLADTPWTRVRITLGSSSITRGPDGGESAAARTDVSASPSALSGRSGGFSVTYAATRWRATSVTSGPPSSGGAPDAVTSSIARWKLTRPMARARLGG